MLKPTNICFDTARSYMLAELKAMQIVSNHWNYYLKRIKEEIIKACIDDGLNPDPETINRTIVRNFDFFYNSIVNIVTEKSYQVASAPSLISPQATKKLTTTIPEPILI